MAVGFHGSIVSFRTRVVFGSEIERPDALPFLHRHVHGSERDPHVAQPLFVGVRHSQMIVMARGLEPYGEKAKIIDIWSASKDGFAVAAKEKRLKELQAAESKGKLTTTLDEK